VSGQWRTVLLAWRAVTIHRWQMQQHGEPGRAFYERANRRTIETNDEVTFSVTRHRTVTSFRWSFGDHYLGGNEVLATALRPSLWNSQGSASAQTRGEFTS